MNELKHSVNKMELVSDFRKLGITPGTELLVHSSLSSIGFVEGGADTVIDALLEAVDPTQGTVLVPTLNGSEHDGPNRPPLFHVKDTPCWTGRIPETFRRRKEARRSLNPTHSVAAIGAAADSLTTGHEDCWTTCGYGSPYYRLNRRGGKILLLGVTLESNTTFHTAEEIAGVSYHLQKEPALCTMVGESGNSLQRLIMLHDWGTSRNFSVMEQPFLSEGIMVAGMVGNAPCLLIDSGLMLEYTCKILQDDPFALIKKS